MAEGSGAYKWHEWEAVFPENNARGPRGVGFQENADCFPDSHAPFPFVPILHPPIPLLLPPRYQSSTSSVAEMYNPPFAYACMRAYRSPLLLLPLRSLSDSYLAVPTASCSPYARTGLRKNRTQRHAHRSYYLIILSTLSKRKRDDCPWARERRGGSN